ncbi:MAG: haloacid dehalogenase-like hydrolase, partial [Selenomonadaceae bacterium]|nr:haloacid dehalogenase-like hydrolase [Selenomonadaceae bacterium]
MLENNHIKTIASFCAALAIGFGTIGTAQGAAREEIASVRVNAKGSNFQYWQKDSQALSKLRAYVKDVTNPKSPDYIPQRDRIALFDVDGTLACETAPFCFDFLMMV